MLFSNLQLPEEPIPARWRGLASLRIATHQFGARLPRFACHSVLLVALIACLALASHATSGDSPLATQLSRNFPLLAPAQFALADFDGDSRPDLATIEVGPGTPLRTHYWVAFRLSSGSRSALGITAPSGGLRIASRDVNGDDFPDVIVTTAWTDRPVAVLLNDGFGNFTESPPGAFPVAFSNSELLLASTPAIPDTSIAFSLRYPSGECDRRLAAASAPQNLSTLLPSMVLGVAFRFSAASFLGRAPPRFVFYS